MPDDGRPRSFQPYHRFLGEAAKGSDGRNHRAAFALPCHFSRVFGEYSVLPWPSWSCLRSSTGRSFSTGFSGVSLPLSRALLCSANGIQSTITNSCCPTGRSHWPWPFSIREAPAVFFGQDGPILLVFVMVAAVVHKTLAADYLDGSFFEFTLLTDQRLAPFMAALWGGQGRSQLQPRDH